MILPRDKGAELRLRLPATSANLGPGFDAAAVALDCYLEIEAKPAGEFSIVATGRDAVRCSRMDDNLILGTYRDLLESHNRPVLPLAIAMVNDIPLGMGLGSSAAGRLAGIALANHFGELGWSSDRVLAEASALEGHPDNAAACWLGGFVMAAVESAAPGDRSTPPAWKGAAVHVARVIPPADWRAIVVIPQEPLATSKARAALPDRYSRSDVVANIQSAGLLGLAFAQGRADLLRIAMTDHIHQPYRAPFCPLLDLILPLAAGNGVPLHGTPPHGILGAALSGAGPAVLVITANEDSIELASTAIRAALAGGPPAELLPCRFEARGASSPV
jgi:homoserine kinase